MRTRTRFFNPATGNYFLFGPRGTGKSTWCEKHYGGPRIDLLKPELQRQYLAHPERLRNFVQRHPPDTTIVLDEIQKIPKLLDVVHELIEKHRGWRFVLTGSSARKLRREGVDLMAGRVSWREMHPYMAAEMGSDFKLEKALQLGMLPVVNESVDPEDTLAAYVGLYIREEVQVEGLVRNLESFTRFVEAASFSHGQLLNISNVARECQTERTSVAGYVNILEDLLLAFRIPVFTKRARRETVAHPKFYYFDTGAFRSLRPSGPLDRPSEIDGGALEGLVAQHLRAWRAYTKKANELYYWRTKAGTEVDFIVYGESGFSAIEVKNTARVQRADLRPLKSFGEDYPEAQRFFLYRGDEELLIDDIFCLPCEKFLTSLRPDQPLGAILGLNDTLPGNA